MDQLLKQLEEIAEQVDNLCDSTDCNTCQMCHNLIEGYSIADFLNAIRHRNDKEYIQRKIVQK